eukprot:2015330-Rhodomonas_salina.2
MSFLSCECLLVALGLVAIIAGSSAMMAAAQLKEERERDRRRRKLDGLAESEYYLLSSKHPAPIHRFSRMASAPSAPAPPLESASTFSSSFRDPPLQK